MTLIPEFLYGIIGHPLGHSLSPLLHNTAFQATGHPGVMLRWPVPPEGVADFMRTVRLLHVRGCCVTIPHKLAVLPWLDEVSERVRAVGACNTLYWKDGALCGENTDVIGFMRPLEGRRLPSSALVLGAGGAARAVVAGLKMLGVADVAVSARRREALLAFCGDCGARPVPWEARGGEHAGLVVNTTPAGMRGAHQEETAYEAAWFASRPAGIAYDVVYTPLETRFLREARACGWEGVDGLQMFLGQADCQFFLWTGKHLPEAAATAVRQALGV